MSRLYDALTAIEERAPSVVPQADLPRMAGAPTSARRRRALVAAAIGVAAAVSVGVVLKVVSKPPLAPLPRQVKPAVTTVAPMAAPETVKVADIRARARAAAARNELEEAQELLEGAVALFPTQAESWNDLGVVRVGRGQLTRGIEAFERAISLQPSNAEAHRNLAVALDRGGEPAAAAQHYRAFLTLAPQHPDRAAVERRLTSR